MTPDELLSLADNPNLIAGIYNYCDRWCERCRMTHRCLLYASTPREEDLPSGSVEEKQHAVVRQIEASFQLTIDLLNKLAQEKGIDLNEIAEDENPVLERKRDRKTIEKSPLTRLAKEYLDQTQRWMDNLDIAANAKDKELQQAHLMQFPDRDPERELAELKNSIDVVHWYYFQINVKLTLAQMSRQSEADHPEDEDQISKDSNGSAKVALIVMENSIGAWGLFLQHFPELEESILNILSILSRLRRMTEAEFPDAHRFHRVGFDDE
ncbi:MAG: hypothetical protein ABIQ02_07600 [Saprospiraceae bacterium]